MTKWPTRPTWLGHQVLECADHVEQGFMEQLEAEQAEAEDELKKAGASGDFFSAWDSFLTGNILGKSECRV